MIRFDIKRFTYKDSNGIYQLDNDYVSGKGIDENGLDEITDYIGKLEDLEEQLGCPLEMYVSIKENGIFIEEEYDEEEHTGLTRLVNIPPRDLCLDFKKDKITIYWEDTLDIYMELKFSDHKKTWWLKEDRSE